MSTPSTPSDSATPHFSNSLSTKSASGEAIDEALGELLAGLGGHEPDLVVAFATHHHGSALEELGPRLADATGAGAVIGCTAESVIGDGREIEGSAGLALWAAALPRTQVRFFELTATPGPDGEPLFSDELPMTPGAAGKADGGSAAGVLVLADPYSFPVDAFLGVSNERHPGVPVMGGMASGAMGPGQSLLFTRDGVRDSGCIGVVLEGEIELLPVVSQGCRPIGKPWVITECKQNRVKKLGGRPALEVLMETWNELSPEDQALLQSAPFLGLAVDARASTFTRGDFLARGIIGLQQSDHSVAVADYVRRGQTVQLLVRDAGSAGDDLLELLEAHGGGALETAPESAGALIFSCNGRGTRMFSEPHHDVTRVRTGLAADVPVAGFFAAGEIGPVGGRNFLHGFTASVAVFRSRDSG